MPLIENNDPAPQMGAVSASPSQVGDTLTPSASVNNANPKIDGGFLGEFTHSYLYSPHLLYSPNILYPEGLFTGDVPEMEINHV